MMQRTYASTAISLLPTLFCITAFFTIEHEAANLHQRLVQARHMMTRVTVCV
jgi:hypothetical protein